MIDPLMYVVIIGIVAIALWISKSWVGVYNYYRGLEIEVERKFHDISTLMQQRIVLINQLSQIASKYTGHEYQTFTDVTKARSGINKQIANVQNIENNFLKLQAVFEQYPSLKANPIYQSLMGDDSVSYIEERIRNEAIGYNKAVAEYNYGVRMFPQLIVAKAHKFVVLEYLTFGGGTAKLITGYIPKQLFIDKEVDVA